MSEQTSESEKIIYTDEQIDAVAGWNAIHRAIAVGAPIPEAYAHTPHEAWLAADAAGLTPLHWAVVRCRLDLVSFLLAQETIQHNCLNATTKAGKTALHLLAAMRWRSEVETILTLLLKTGASIDIEDKQGNRPIHIAAAADNSEMVRRLIQAGSLVRIKNNDGKYPWHCRTLPSQNPVLATAWARFWFWLACWWMARSNVQRALQAQSKQPARLLQNNP